MNNAGHGSDDKQSQKYSGGSPKGPDGNKEKTSSAPSGDFAKGGTTHMFQGSSSAPQEPGQSAQQFSGGSKFISGGNGKMFHDGNGATAAVAGEQAAKIGMGSKFAEGGKTKMFGPQTAGPATAGHSVK